MSKLKTVDIADSERDDFLAAVKPYLRELRPGWEPTEEWERSYFDELQGEPQRWLWWAEVDGERVGFANFAVVQDMREPERLVGELSEFTIFPEHRRAGYGARLAREVVRKLREAGASTIEAIVRADDEAGTAFWGSVGFAPVARVLSLPPDVDPPK